MSTGIDQKEDETFLQQVLNIHFLGEIFATIIAFTPLTIIALARIYLFHVSTDPGRLLFLFCGVMTFIWVIILEHYGRVKLTTPVIPIPLKYVIPILTLLVVIFGK